MELEQNIEKTKPKYIFIIIIIALLILFVFYYLGYFEKLFKPNVGLRVQTCTTPSCNPSNSQQYCLNNQWANCDAGQICSNGQCVSQPNYNNQPFTDTSSIGTTDDNESKNFSGNDESGGGGGGAGGGTGGSGAGGLNYTLTIIKAGDGFGAVNVDDGEFNCGSTSNQCTINYNQVSQVNLKANVYPGSIFAGWDGSCSGVIDTCVLTMDASRTVIATFNSIPESH